jgi:hypothetical protein
LVFEIFLDFFSFFVAFLVAILTLLGLDRPLGGSKPSVGNICKPVSNSQKKSLPRQVHHFMEVVTGKAGSRGFFPCPLALIFSTFAESFNPPSVRRRGETTPYEGRACQPKGRCCKSGK